jgi:ribosomal protein S18 acetylase RimI-like enzyme
MGLDLANGLRVELAHVTEKTWQNFQNGILELECESFAASIRDTPNSLMGVAYSETSVFIACYYREQSHVVGYVCGDRLSQFADIPGVAADLRRQATNSFYLSSVAVHASWRGLGIGKALQQSCIVKVQQKGYTRVTAHVRHGVAIKITDRPCVLSSYNNWYGTGEKYDYVSLWRLRSGGANAAT